MANVMSIVTDRIIAALEKGCVPWRKPWYSPNRGAYNRISGKKYSLLNQFILSNEGEYASFRQWSDLGGRIKKGAKSEIVVFWKWQEVEVETESTDDQEQNKKKKMRPVLRYYRVFHISQIEGVTPLQETPVYFRHESIDSAEHVLAEYIAREKITFEAGNYAEAYFSPSMDMIHVPAIWLFERPEEYYSTVFHEAVHSTGIESRLNREGVKKVNFGSEQYSKEELVAEIGATGILANLGIETEESFNNATAYIQSWIRVLKNDQRLVVVAAGQAEKAINFIMSRN